MGTYPTTPSYVLSSGDLLQDVLDANKEALIGSRVLSKHGADLPFLPKILSIAKALPLQLHPNKSLAAKLHQQNPEKFTDSNHKPEIAVALSDFELFVGWKPLDMIKGLFKLEALHRFLPGDSTADFDDKTLRSVCASMLKASETAVKEVEASLQSLPREKYGEQAYILDLLPRIQDQYGNADNGALVALLCMNFMKLKPGDAVFVPEDSIHAYLSGDIVECMARSNNVLNTGFCPAPDRDSVDVFMDTLSLAPHDADAALLHHRKSDKGNGKTIVYAPPNSEFNVLATLLNGGEQETIEAIDGPSIMVVTDGRGSMMVESEDMTVKEGFIYFIGKGVKVKLIADEKEKLSVYRAYCE